MAVSPQQTQQSDPYPSYTIRDLRNPIASGLEISSKANIDNTGQPKRLLSYKSLSSLKDTSQPNIHSSSMSSASTTQTTSKPKKRFKDFFQKIGQKNSTNDGQVPLPRADHTSRSTSSSANSPSEQPQRQNNRKAEADTSLISEQSWGPGIGLSPDPVVGITLLDQAEQDYHGQQYGTYFGEHGIGHQQFDHIPAPSSPRFAPNGELSRIQEEQGGDKSNSACSGLESSSGLGVSEENGHKRPTVEIPITTNEHADTPKLPLTPASTHFTPQSEHPSQGSSRTAEFPTDKPFNTSPRSNTARSLSSGIAFVATTPSSTIGNGSLERIGRGSTPSDRLGYSTDQGSLTGHYTVHHQTSHLSSQQGSVDSEGYPQPNILVQSPTTTSFKTKLFPSFGGKQQSIDPIVTQKKANKADKFKTLGRLGHPVITSTKRHPTTPILTSHASKQNSVTPSYAPAPVALEPLRTSPTEEKTTFARRLIRRVASAPNAKGLFSASGGTLGSSVFSVASGNTTQVDSSPNMTPTGYTATSSVSRVDSPSLAKLNISEEPDSTPQASQSPLNMFAPFSRKQTSTSSPKQSPVQMSLPKSPIMSSPYLGASTSTLGSTSTGAQASARGIGPMGAREGRASSVGILSHKSSSGNLLGINGVNGKPVRPNALTADQKGSFRRTYSSNSIRTKTVG